MTSKTEYDVDINVNGTSSLRQAADALAAVNENMRDMARSLTAAINGLDRLEQKFAGVRNNAKAGAQGIDTLTKATEKYNKVVNTVKGQSVDLVPTSKAPAFRQPNGQFMSSSTQDDIKSRAVLHNQEQLNNALKIAQRSYYETAFASEKYAHVGEQLSKTLGHLSDNDLPRLRYALYDVASTYAAVSVTLLTLSAASIKVAADFETAFTSVERTLSDSTMPGQISGIREELINLSTQIPVSFEEISRIATLGNQLGIEANDIAGFTETVAQFSAITGVATETTAQNFGTIGNLLNVMPSEYSNLASAIALTGKNSVATEAQILSLTNEIAAGAGQAGFTAQEVVGLSATLASLRVPPERSRGALTTYFETLNQAVAEGGDSLASFATIVGVTSEQLVDMVNNGQGEEVFQGFIKGLNDLNSTSKTKALDDLNLAQLRISDTFRRLSEDTELYNATQADSAKGWAENAELARQYALISDDLNTQFQLLVQSLNALVEELTGGMVPGLSGAVSVLVEFVNYLRELAKSPVAQTVIGISLALATLAGLFAAYKAATALATASTLALVTIQRAAIAENLGQAAGIRGLIATLLGYTSASNGATAATAANTIATRTNTATLGLSAANMGRVTAAAGVLKSGLIAFGPAGAAITAALVAIPLAQFAADSESAAKGLQDIKTAADATSASLPSLKGALKSSFDEITKYEEDLAGINGEIPNINAAVNDFFSQFFDATPALTDAREQLALIDTQLASMVSNGQLAAAANLIQSTGVNAYRAARLLPQYSAALREVGAASSNINAGPIAAFSFSANQAANNLDKVGKSAGGAAKKVVTLKDYANDLADVFQRAFEIRFSSQDALDTITSQWRGLNEELEEYQRKVMELTADRSVTQYFLSVAEAYGDTLRAGVLRSDLADIEAELSDAQSVTNKTLVGNSKAAVSNRKVITGLVTDYQDYIESLAASGATQAQLQAATAQSRVAFLQQAQALGFSTNELEMYAAAFDDIAFAIAKVPRNITVTANTNPATQALNEFLAKVQSSSANVSINGSVTAGARDALFYGWVKEMQDKYHVALAQSASGWANVRANWERGVFGQFAEGGRIAGPGTQTSDSIPIMASDGEYMVKASSASRLGTPVLNYLNRYGRLPGFATGGQIGVPTSSSGAGVTEWGSWERRVLMQIARNTAQQPVISAQAVTNSVNSTNVNASSRRSA